MQIIAEFGRVFSKDVETIFRQRWDHLQEKLFQIFEREHDNTRLQSLLALTGEGEASASGMSTGIILLYMCHDHLTCSFVLCNYIHIYFVQKPRSSQPYAACFTWCLTSGANHADHSNMIFLVPVSHQSYNCSYLYAYIRILGLLLLWCHNYHYICYRRTQ